jgi:hypothetical protein
VKGGRPGDLSQACVIEGDDEDEGVAIGYRRCKRSALGVA